MKRTIVSGQKELSDEELVAHAMGINMSTSHLYGVSYFENSTWFVAYVGPVGEVIDVEPTIAKYVSGSWAIVGGGTGVDFSSDVSLPASVREYFKGRGI